jgi:hypothetical protein
VGVLIALILLLFALGAQRTRRVLFSSGFGQRVLLFGLLLARVNYKDFYPVDKLRRAMKIY